MEHRGARAALLRGKPQGFHRLTPAGLFQADQTDEEVGVRVGPAQLRDAAKLARGFIEHPGLVKGDSQIAVLFHAGVGHLHVFRAGGAAGTVQEARRHQPVQRLPDLEFSQAGVFDDLIHVAGPVEQRQEAILDFGQPGVADGEAITIHQKNQIE